MKITNFSFTLRQASTKDGYGDNYYVNIDDNGVVNISHPYKSIEYKEQVALLGFGNFAVVERPERQGVNPSTGAKITIAAKKSVKFKAGSALNAKL